MQKLIKPCMYTRYKEEKDFELSDLSIKGLNPYYKNVVHMNTTVYNTLFDWYKSLALPLDLYALTSNTNTFAS